MQRDFTTRLGTVVASVLSMSSPASAAEAPYDFVACTHTQRTMLEANADIVAFGIETFGVVASSTTPEWEKASTHCVGSLRVIGGKPVGKGLCKWFRASGDTAVGEFEIPASGAPTWTWLAGTGALKGIRGGGTFNELFNAPPAEPGTSQGCRRDWGRTVLP